MEVGSEEILWSWLGLAGSLAHRVVQEPIDLYIDSDSSDEEVVRALEKHLRAGGFRGELQRRKDVPPGADFEAVIESWIRSARVVVLVWSADALASDQGQRAVSLAGEREPGTTFALLARPCDVPQSPCRILPEGGGALSRHPDQEHALQQIARTIRPHLPIADSDEWQIVDTNDPGMEARTISFERDSDVGTKLAVLVEALSGPAHEPWFNADEENEDLRARRAEMAIRERPGRWAKVADHWIVALGAEELRAKRDRVKALRAQQDPLRGWDGEVLQESALAPWKFRWETNQGIPSLHDDELLAAFYGLSTAPEKVRGIVVIGAPGSGKSLLSRLTERRFLSGPLSALGLAVRRSARDLAASAAEHKGASLAKLLLLQGLNAHLFNELAGQRRLFLIIDGLDEIGARALRSVAKLLHESKLPFFATSREMPQALGVLPQHATLRIEPLRRQDALRVLHGWGRPDLAVQLESRAPHSYMELKDDDAMATLCRTPFHLALLCKAVRQDERVRPEGESELYRRVFDGLLELAVEDERLQEEQAEVLRRRNHVLVGNLAITWLRSKNGRLSEIQVSAALESPDLTGGKALEIRRALEFGYLLTPGSDGIEFTHRTIAEWVAARALAHRVHAAVERATHAGKPLTPSEAADIEQRELTPFLKSEERDVRPKAWPLLRFYMPQAVAPLAVVRRFLGPQMLDAKESYAVEHFFDAAFELASLASWSDAGAACIAWGIFLRAATFPIDETSHAQHLLSNVPDARLAAFVESVAEHLPATIDELVSLAARTETQAERLRADPSVLVCFCPKQHLPLFEHLLLRGTPHQKLRILEQYVVLGERLSYEVERNWPATLPGRISAEKNDTDRYALIKVEEVLYEALVNGSSEIPWDALRQRIFDWPGHLRPAITRWFCVPERRETRYGFLSADATSTNVRTQALSVVLAELTGRRTTLWRLLREAAARPDAAELARQLQGTVETDEPNDPWPRFVKVARAAGWEFERGRSSAGRACPRDAPILLAFAAYDERQRQVHGLLPALRAAGRLDSVVGPLWALLAPADEQRRVLLEELIEARSIPQSVRVEEVLGCFDDADHLPYELTTEKMFPPAHEHHLRELARSGEGHVRFLALLWCARRDEKDETNEVAAHLADGDAAFRQCAATWMRSRGNWRAPKPGTATQGLSPESLAAAPLPFRAQADAPGWREELIDALRVATPENQHQLSALVRDHQVREALPVLLGRFREEPDHFFADAIAALAVPGDREAIELLISADLPHFGFPPRVLALLTLADLPKILNRSDPPKAVSAARPDADGLARFGPEAHAMFVEAYRARTEAAKRDRSPQETRSDSSWIGALREAALRTVDASRTPMDAIVALLQELIGGDRHVVYSMPGPLGSEYDQPHDLEYESELALSKELKLAVRLVERRLDRRPDEASSAALLLAHPSETLQLGIFNALASRAPKHEVAALAVLALESHLRATNTNFEGETTGLFLASVTRGGSGSIDIRLPEVGKKLADAVSSHLTAAHRTTLEELARHPQPAIRRLACGWIRERGTAAWVPLLVPAVADTDARVVMTALRSLQALDVASLASAVASTPRNTWSAPLYAAVIDWLAYRHGRISGDFEPPTPRRADEVLPTALVATLVAEALDVLSTHGKPPQGLETLLLTLGEGPHMEHEPRLSTPSLQARAAHCGADMRAVLLRALAHRGSQALPEDVVTRVSSGPLEDRLAAAESLAVSGRVELCSEVIGAWNDAFQDQSRHDFTALRLRLARMLERAPSAFAPAWQHLLDDLPFDYSEGCLTEEGEELLRAAEHCLQRWGKAGLETLLETVPSDPERWKPHGEAWNSVTSVFGAETVRKMLQARASHNPALAKAAAELPQDRHEQGRRLKEFVALDILPDGWCS